RPGPAPGDRAPGRSRAGAPSLDVIGAGARARHGQRSDRGRARGSQAAAEDHRSEEHTSELQSLTNLVCRLLLEKKKNTQRLHLSDWLNIRSTYRLHHHDCATISRTTVLTQDD